MMGVGFSVDHLVVCERPVLCFLRPAFCASPITAGTDLRAEFSSRGCGLPCFTPMSFPVGLWVTRPRSVIFLKAVNFSERQAVLAWVLYPPGRVWSHWKKQLAHGSPLCGTQARCGGEALGRAGQAVRQDGLPKQWADSTFYSIVGLFVIVAKTQVGRDEKGFMLGLGWWKLFPSVRHWAHSCVTSLIPSKGSTCHQPSPPLGKMA